MKSKTFVIPYVIYPFELMVSYGTTHKQLMKELTDRVQLSDLDEENFEGLGTKNGRCAMLSGGQTVIWLAKEKNKVDLIGFITHEALHAVIFLYGRIGIKLKPMVSDEAFTYLQQYIVKEIVKQLKVV